MKVDVDLWEILDGKVTKLKYKDIIFRPEDTRKAIHLRYPLLKRFYTIDEDKFILRNWNKISILEISKRLKRTYESVKSRYRLLKRYLDNNDIPRNWPRKEDNY